MSLDQICPSPVAIATWPSSSVPSGSSARIHHIRAPAGGCSSLSPRCLVCSQAVRASFTVSGSSAKCTAGTSYACRQNFRHKFFQFFSPSGGFACTDCSLAQASASRGVRFGTVPPNNCHDRSYSANCTTALSGLWLVLIIRKRARWEDWSSRDDHALDDLIDFGDEWGELGWLCGGADDQVFTVG